MNMGIRNWFNNRKFDGTFNKANNLSEYRYQTVRKLAEVREGEKVKKFIEQADKRAKLLNDKGLKGITSSNISNYARKKYGTLALNEKQSKAVYRDYTNLLKSKNKLNLTSKNDKYYNRTKKAYENRVKKLGLEIKAGSLQDTFNKIKASDEWYKALLKKYGEKGRRMLKLYHRGKGQQKINAVNFIEKFNEEYNAEQELYLAGLK